jgi:hypothetical protein
VATPYAYWVDPRRVDLVTASRCGRRKKDRRQAKREAFPEFF